jgi:hypothetical protein
MHKLVSLSEIILKQLVMTPGLIGMAFLDAKNGKPENTI